MIRKTMCCLVLAFAFAVTSASAGSPAGAPAPADSRAAQPAQTVETSTTDEAAISVPPCTEPGTEAELFTPASGDDGAADVNGLDAAPVGQAGRPVRGYCRCTCSLTPNCSTNADCGGGLCLKGPTCC